MRRHPPPPVGYLIGYLIGYRASYLIGYCGLRGETPRRVAT